MRMRLWCLSWLCVTVVSATGCGSSDDRGTDLNGMDAVDDVADVAVDEGFADFPDTMAPDLVGEDTEDVVTDVTNETAFDTLSDVVDEAAEDTTSEVSPDIHEDLPTDPDVIAYPACDKTWSGAPWDGAVDSPFAFGPYLQSVIGDEATVVFRAIPAVAEPGCVIWSLNDDLWHETCGLPDEGGHYEVRLAPLPPDTLVTYSVNAGILTSGVSTFRSAPAYDQPVRFLLFSDAHDNATYLPPIIAAGLEAGVDFAVSVGDTVPTPTEEHMASFFAMVRPLGQHVTLWPTLGNHEGIATPIYFQSYVVPGAAPAPIPERFYSVRIGNLWMASLDLTDFYVAHISQSSTIETRWLAEVLASPAATSASYRLLFIHEPPYLSGWGGCPGYHGEEPLRHELVPLAASMGVDAIISGHVHGYERGMKDGVHLVIVGGAGGNLDHDCDVPDDFPSPWFTNYVHHHAIVDAGCDELVLRAIGTDGVEFDRLEIPASSW